MKRRTLDIMFSIGGVGLAVLLVVLGLVLTNRANFADDYVADELVEQKITFKPADELEPREREYTEARSGCVLRYAGEVMTTGKQAECYAKEYLGGHLTWLATRLGMTTVADLDGQSYTELGAEQGRLRTEIAAAQDAGEPVADLEQRLTDVTTLRTKLFEGTMLKNALLTSYGFSSFSDTADTAATVAYTVAGLLFVLAMAGFVHAFVTPKNKGIGIIEPMTERGTREPVSV